MQSMYVGYGGERGGDETAVATLVPSVSWTSTRFDRVGAKLTNEGPMVHNVNNGIVQGRSLVMPCVHLSTCQTHKERSEAPGRSR